MFTRPVGAQAAPSERVRGRRRAALASTLRLTGAPGTVPAAGPRVRPAAPGASTAPRPALRVAPDGAAAVPPPHPGARWMTDQTARDRMHREHRQGR